MTDRISSFQSSPATTFTLEADVVETQASYGTNGRWRVRFYLRANNGPGGTSGSSYLGSGSQTGQRSLGSTWSTVRTHSGNPFLPSGYSDEAQRWRDGPTDVWVVANDNGYWWTSLTSMPLRMLLAYGSVNVVATGSVPVSRIARAPGAPGQPSVSSITATSANFAWSAAARGNANITEYEWQIATTSNFASPIGGTHSAGNALSDSTTGEVTLSPVTGYFLRVRAVNGDGDGAWSSARSFTTAPAGPDAPTIGTPVRVSNTQQTVHWTRVASAAAPYDSQQIQRAVFSGAGGSWGSPAGVGTIGTDYTSGGAQSWSDTGTVGNRAYRYRVKASNPSGEALSGWSATVFTTPGAPSSVVASKTPSGDVKIDFTRTVAFTGHQHEIEYSTNGGVSYSALATVGSMVETYTWVSPPTGDPLFFRVRAKVNDGSAVGHGLTSFWVVSNVVNLTAPPNAPSALNPNGVVFDAADGQVFVWQHNPSDSSPQSKYQFRYRKTGDAWTTGSETTSSTSEHTITGGTLDNGESYEWAVRTWGIHADPSPWSATATFTTSTAPVVSITSPEATFETSQLVAEWSFYDDEATTQTAWQAELVQDGVTVETRNGSISTSTTFSTILTDTTEYTVRLRGRDGDGLWSAWDEVTFTTDFIVPPAPNVQLVWDGQSGSVQVTVGNPDAGEGEAEPVYNTIFRSVDGETWVLLDGQVPLNSTVTDRTVPLGQEVFYKAVTWSALPSATESPVESILPPAVDVYWSGGAGFGTVLRVQGGLNSPPRVDLSEGLLSRVLHYFAGRTRPVEAAGTQTTRAGSVTFVTLDLPELATVQALSYLPAPHLIRTPDGITLFCSIGPVGQKRVVDGIYEVAFDVAEVEH